MCVGNRAQSSIVYVNGQLHALYTNATKCVDQHLGKPYLKPTSTPLYYGVALSMGFIGEHKESNSTTDDLAFYASFGQPEIEFPCNHEVILRLKLDSGHYYLNPANIAARTDFANKRSIGQWEVEVGIPFSESSSLIENDAIGNVKLYDLSYIILSMDKAVFGDVRVQNSHKSVKLSPDNAVALKTYLSQYLIFLKHAGYHVFYTLPDFDDVKGTDPINYSLATHADGVPILSITVENMTKYLASRWTEATYRSDKSAKFRYLFEVQNAVDDVKFSISFRPPIVKALCEHEVAFIFDIKKLQFVKANSVTVPFDDWKVAFLIRTDLEHSKAGQMLRINVSTAQYYSYLSTTRTTLTAEGEALQQLLIKYLRATYLKQFETIHDALIYDSGFVQPPPPPRRQPRLRPEDTEVGCWMPSGCPHSGSKGHVCWGLVINQMIDFKGVLPWDFTTSITQGALNAQFAWFWKRAKVEVDALPKDGTHLGPEHVLSQFRYIYGEHVYFEASFKAPQIQLVCSKGSRTAIIHVFLEKGMLKPLLEGKTEPDISAEDYSFGAWRLAFRVPLALRSCATTSDLPGFVHTHFGRSDFRNFKQLVLNFESASFVDIDPMVPEDSDEDVEGLLSGEYHRALVAYFKTKYFPGLVNNGHHILYTIPVGYSLDSLSLTALDWQICSIPFGAKEDQFREGIGGRYERNAILFLGMTGHHPRPKLTEYPFWITAGFDSKIPSATAVLSREIGVDGLLVPLLSEINRDTTVVLGSPRFEKGLWIPDVTTWGYQAAQRQGEDCKFKFVEDGVANALNYAWSNVESWKYERGPANAAHSSWSISCSTLNKLSIPTGTVNGPCAITLEGHTTLKLDSDFKTDSSQSPWSSEVQGDWSTTITLEQDANGIKLTTPSKGDIAVRYTKGPADTASSGNPNALDAAQLLQEQLQKAHAGHLVTGLQGAFDGVWGYLFASASSPNAEGVQAGALCARRPVFTKGGSFILELHQYEVAQTQWASIPVPNFPPGEIASSGSVNGRNSSVESTRTQLLDPSLPTSPTRTTSQYGDAGTRTPVLASNLNLTRRGGRPI